jgi:hypothetical protein
MRRGVLSVRGFVVIAAKRARLGTKSPDHDYRPVSGGSHDPALRCDRLGR